MPEVASKSRVIRVKMAGVDFAEADDLLDTLLGSCVGIALWDRRAKRGGLAHVVLPDSRGVNQLPGKFADTAVDELKRHLLAMGSSPSALVAKIAGGATMFGKRSDRDVGEKNHRAVLEHLRRHGIRCIAEDIGGDKGRMIRFSPADGTVTVSIARQVVRVL